MDFLQSAGDLQQDGDYLLVGQFVAADLVEEGDRPEFQQQAADRAVGTGFDQGFLEPDGGCEVLGRQFGLDEREGTSNCDYLSNIVESYLV